MWFSWTRNCQCNYECKEIETSTTIIKQGLYLFMLDCFPVETFVALEKSVLECQIYGFNLLGHKFSISIRAKTIFYSPLVLLSQGAKQGLYKWRLNAGVLYYLVCVSNDKQEATIV